MKTGIKINHTRLITALIAALFVLLLSHAAAAAPNSGDLLKSTGARAVGLGGAFTAVADDYSAFFWNPAGLAQARRININGYYDQVFKGTQAGFGFSYVNPIISVSPDAPLEMTLAAAFMKNFYTGSGFDDTNFYLSYATYISGDRDLSAGINLKYINSALRDYNISGTGISLDLGLLYSTEIYYKKTRFGVALQDFDASIYWEGGARQRLPTIVKIGSCFLIDDSFLTALDLDLVNDTENRRPQRRILHFGAEKYYYNDFAGNFGFRAGFSWKEAAANPFNLTFGFTYGRQDFAINYLFSPDSSTLGETHKIDFSYFLSPPAKVQGGPKKKKPEDQIVVKDTRVFKERFRDASFDISGRYISPDADGKMDAVDFTFKNYPEDVERINWSIEIQNPAGATVRTFSGRDAPPDLIAWDGKGESAAKLPDGDYTAKFTVFFEGSEVWQRTRVVAIDTTAPSFDAYITPKLFAPHPQSTVREMQVYIKSRFQDIESWVFYVRDVKGNLVKRMNGKGLSERLIWDGKDALGNTVLDGDYTVDLEAMDFAGNIYVQKEKFAVDTAVMDYTTSADYRIFEPGTPVRIELSGADAGAIKKWDVEIRTEAGTLVKSFRNRGPGSRYATWDGTNASNAFVRGGSVYNVKVILTQKNGITTTRETYLQTKPPEFKELGMRLTLAAVDFAQGSGELPKEKYEFLDQAAQSIERYAKDYNLLIKGYAADTTSGEDNLKLSLERAKAVKDYLVKEKGIPSANVYVTGYGDGEFSEDVTREYVEKNARRVEVELVTK